MIGLILSILFTSAVANATALPKRPESIGQIHVRRVIVKKDQIVDVRTSSGIATLIDVAGQPTTAIIGDLDAFRLEYIENAVTIKPLRSGAKTNLYIYTDLDRFNIHLLPVTRDLADYVVYLRREQRPRAVPDNKISWRNFKASVLREGIMFRIKKLGVRSSGFRLIEFELVGQKPLQLKPEWFWITQNGLYKPIDSLSLSNLDLAKDAPVNGSITLKDLDLDLRLPILVEIRGIKGLSIRLPEVNKWPK